MGPMTTAPIRIAAALLVRGDGCTLLVRKRGTACFMQPGGKIAPGEAPRAALVRELREELGLRVEPAALAALGRFRAPAAHETGATVEAELFRLDWSAETVEARAEIEEIAWVDPVDTGGRLLAALTRDHVLPLCRPRATPDGAA